MISWNFKRVIGLAGVSQSQGWWAWRIGVIFDWLLLVIAFWLPIQWYLQAIYHFSEQATLISDWVIWLVFVVEWITLLFLVKNKINYIVGNWLNLVIILLVNPFWFIHISQFAIIRLIRLLVLIRIILPWAHSAQRALALNRLGVTFVVFVLTTSLSGIMISIIDPGVKDPFTGIWWAFETVTTVGYGDVVPSSPLGKLMAMVVMCMGIVMFSILTASVSAYFVGKDQKQQISMLLRRQLNKKNTHSEENSETLNEFFNGLTKKEKLALFKKLKKEFPDYHE